MIGDVKYAVANVKSRVADVNKDENNEKDLDEARKSLLGDPVLLSNRISIGRPCLHRLRQTWQNA